MAIAGLPEEEYFAKGHRACAGCGAAIVMRLLTKAAGKDTILVESTGCMEVISTPYPQTAWKLPWIHGAFENNASIGSGVEAALKKLGRKANVVVFGGDGATYDIGLGAISGMFERGHNITYVCYDNEAYMNTGIQRSSSTPFGAATTTSPAGKKSFGKQEWKKDIVHIIAAHGSPYVATSSVAYTQDVYKKIKKAIEIEGPTFVNVYCGCVPGWKYQPEKTIELSKLGVETGVTPIFEIINGKHKVGMPANIEKLKPVEEYLKPQGRFRHLFVPEKDEENIAFIQEKVKDNIKLLIKYQECDL